MEMSTKSIQLQTGHTLFCWSKYNSANEIMSILTIKLWAWLNSHTALVPATHPNVESFGFKGTTNSRWRWPWGQSLGFKTGICSGWCHDGLAIFIYSQRFWFLGWFVIYVQICSGFLPTGEPFPTVFLQLSLLPWAGLVYNRKLLWAHLRRGLRTVDAALPVSHWKRGKEWNWRVSPTFLTALQILGRAALPPS